MLKKRMIASLIIKDGIVVQSIGFNRYLPVGRPEIQVEYFTSWGIDEIIILDINATKFNKEPDYDLIEKVSRVCYVPLTVGGGIKSVEQIQKLIHHGADKICINNVALQRPKFIQESAEIFGSQCIVVSLDSMKNKSGGFDLFNYLNYSKSEYDLLEFAMIIEELGAGEIYLNSVDRDGSKRGLDINLINSVAEKISIPLIACGGVGNPRHIFEGFTLGNADAVAVANYFHFTEHSIAKSKSFLTNKNITIRKNDYITYNHYKYNSEGVISRKSDAELEHLRFKYIVREHI